eukprot:1296643-Alexandrium_andersonii.AAC.1
MIGPEPSKPSQHLGHRARSSRCAECTPCRGCRASAPRTWQTRDLQEGQPLDSSGDRSTAGARAS